MSDDKYLYEYNDPMKTQMPQLETPTPVPNDICNVSIQGHLKIFDPETQEVFIDKRNAIHAENFSIALARSLSNQGFGMIAEMSFGNGGTRVDQTGIITYLTPNVVGNSASLYNQTYSKSVGSNQATRNYMEVRHVTGTSYSDILVSCLLDFGEPSGQQAFDNTTNANGQFVFDEIGLRAASASGQPSTGSLLTHVIFHPTQKSLNRMIQIDYTVRIQTLGGM